MKKFICIKDFTMFELVLKVGDECLIEVDDIGFILRAAVNGESLTLTMPARNVVRDISKALESKQIFHHVLKDHFINNRSTTIRYIKENIQKNLRNN